jgi:hypothetical protein
MKVKQRTNAVELPGRDAGLFSLPANLMAEIHECMMALFSYFTI